MKLNNLVLFLSTIEEADSTSTNKLANFMFENYGTIFAVFVILVCVVIALSVFLVLLWKYYKKDELILRKYNINASNEDIEELKKLDNKL